MKLLVSSMILLATIFIAEVELNGLWLELDDEDRSGIGRNADDDSTEETMVPSTDASNIKATTAIVTNVTGSHGNNTGEHTPVLNYHWVHLKNYIVIPL